MNTVNAKSINEPGFGSRVPIGKFVINGVGLPSLVAVTTEDPVQVVSQLVGNQALGSEGSTVSKLSRKIDNLMWL